MMIKLGNISISISIRMAAWRDIDFTVPNRRKPSGLVANARNWARQAVQRGWKSEWQEFLASEQTLALVFADNDTVKKLNYDWRGKDKATNVLSFPADLPPVAGHQFHQNPPGMALHLGDVILAYETVIAEAQAQHKSPAHHTAHLVIHGVLHLLGYDHETERDANDMENLEISLLNYFGIGNPYLECDIMQYQD
ncbi:MAG: rRNA maturation RNase YbeY [Alphaproteobacteria bacterium]|nr:rRNA maturation RNase YbeY [Alphaproteobacteria bacterium]